jgi:hypothetical protein
MRKLPAAGRFLRAAAAIVLLVFLFQKGALQAQIRRPGGKAAFTMDTVRVIAPKMDERYHNLPKRLGWVKRDVFRFDYFVNFRLRKESRVPDSTFEVRLSARMKTQDHLSRFQFVAGEKEDYLDLDYCFRDARDFSDWQRRNGVALIAGFLNNYFGEAVIVNRGLVVGQPSPPWEKRILSGWDIPDQWMEVTIGFDVDRPPSGRDSLLSSLSSRFESLVDSGPLYSDLSVWDSDPGIRVGLDLKFEDRESALRWHESNAMSGLMAAVFADGRQESGSFSESFRIRSLR